MFDLFETIEQTIREILINFISGNLNSMFTDVNERTIGIAGEVSQTPQQWNPGIFSMIPLPPYPGRGSPRCTCSQGREKSQK